MSLLVQIIVVALFSMFVYACTQQGMILHWIRRLMFRFPPWLTKPLINCTVCMAPWYGSLLFAVGAIPFVGWIPMLLVLGCAGGLNYVLVNLFKYNEDDD